MFDFISSLMQQSGYFGVAFLMLLENVFPPIPSELIMPMAGYIAAQGHLNIWLVILAGTIGSVAGAWFWYEIGRRLGMKRICRLAERHGRWLTLSPDEVTKARDWFVRNGGATVFFGRILPGVRTLISVPAGIARMRLLPFFIYSTLGTALWTALLTGGGYVLQGRFDAVEAWLNPISNAAFALMAGFYVYRVVTWQGGKSGGDGSAELEPER